MYNVICPKPGQNSLHLAYTCLIYMYVFKCALQQKYLLYTMTVTAIAVNTTTDPPTGINMVMYPL